MIIFKLFLDADGRWIQSKCLLKKEFPEFNSRESIKTGAALKKTKGGESIRILPPFLIG